jgi:hypothetical protein
MLQMYSASLQREMRGGILLDASFMNNSSKHNEDHLPINQLPPQYWSLGPLLNFPLNSPQVQALGYKAPYVGWDMTLPLYRIFTPFPQYTNFTDDASNHTSCDYNAGIFKAQKRFSAGLTFLASYTVSKYLTDTTWSPAATARSLATFMIALSKSRSRGSTSRNAQCELFVRAAIRKGQEAVLECQPCGERGAGRLDFFGNSNLHEGNSCLGVRGSVNRAAKRYC